MSAKFDLPAEGVFAFGSKTLSSTVQNMSPRQRARWNRLSGSERASYTRGVAQRAARAESRAAEARRAQRNAAARARRAARR